MDKYGVFEVVGTSRLKCKRVNDRNADPDGMRDFTYLKCPHCNKDDIHIPTASLSQHKSSAIRDHIMTCPSFVGERPAKRGKKDDVEKLKAEMLEMQCKMEYQQEKVEKLEDKTTLYDGVLAAVMPSLSLPLMAPEQQARISLREAAIKDIQPHHPTLMPPVETIPKDTHIQMIGFKDEKVEYYKSQLEAKELELAKTIEEKQEVERRAEEVAKAVAVVSYRADRLQNERDIFKEKFDAEIRRRDTVTKSKV